mmetsp:Transcript_13659/g.29471  ORF Transcript_13659/g.29471 Transcript_13659/m.29471 type:complete len:270 (+) Transcript_13659:38-847(+)
MSCFAQKRQPSSNEFACTAKAAASFSYEKKLNENIAGALQLANCIFEDHLQPGSPLEIGVTPKQRHYIEDFLFKWNASGKDMPPRPPKGLFASPYRSVYRTVAFDIIPRFRLSIHCKELSKLHLSRTLTFERCRDLLLPAFSEYEREIVDFWLSTNRFETEYTALASGWPTSSTVEIAVGVLKTHYETIGKLISAEQLAQLQRKSVEAPLDLFKVPMLAALNALCAPYETFLHSPSSASFLAFLNVSLIIRQAPAPFPCKDPTGYTAGW